MKWCPQLSHWECHCSQDRVALVENASSFVYGDRTRLPGSISSLLFTNFFKLQYIVALQCWLLFGCAGSLLLHGVFSSCNKQGLFSVCSAWAFNCRGFSLQSMGSRHVNSVVVAPGIQSTGSVVLAQGLSCLRSTWDLPGPEIKPTSLALADGFFTTEPPGKPHQTALWREM